MKVCQIKTSLISLDYHYYTTCGVHEKGSALIRFKTTTATASNPAAVVRIYQTLTEIADQNTNAEMSFFLVCSCTTDPIAHRKRLVEQMSSGTLRYAFQQTTKQMSTSFFQLKWNDFYSNVCSLSLSVLTNWWHVSFDFILWHTQSIDLINSFKKSTKVWFFIIHSNANQ